jgi:hypothetical protein
LEAARRLHVERRNGCGSCPAGCMAQEAAGQGGLQHLIQLSARRSSRDAHELAADLAAMKTAG